jgi:hypothetical protein
MRQPDPPPQLGKRIAAQRRALEGRPDVSQRLRELTASSTQHVGERPKRSPLLGMLMVGAGAALLTLCAVAATIAVSGGLWVQGQLSDPGTTVQDFYGALHRQDYHGAYALCSTRYQSGVSESAFTTQLGNLDTVAGVVDRYIIVGSQVSGQTATVTVHVVRHADPTSAQVQTLTLASQSGSWRIDQVQSGDTVPAATAAP